MGQKNNLLSDIKFPRKWADLVNMHFRIPIYQRKYAWQKEEVERLITDLHDWDIQKGQYFIGNIVVEKLPNGTYDVIDGQQRLTTLYLIASSIKMHSFTLEYAVRENDNDFLKSLKDQKETSFDALIEKHQPNSTFKNNYSIIEELKPIEDILDKVKCSLTILSPDEIDIAKYFEVMNSRGKQLEKHQVLKAKFLEAMDEEDKHFYAKLWDYCSRMDTYIEDMIYKYDKRKSDGTQEIPLNRLRLDLIEFASSEDTRITKFFKGKSETSNNDRISILEAIDHKNNTEETERDGVNRYRSLVKFEYFLLHVLNLEAPQKVTINDGQLIEQYDEYFKDYKNLDQVKSFLNQLLKYRLVYDYFFYKRDDNTDNPFFAMILLESDKIDTHRVAKIDRDSSNESIRTLLNIQLLFNFTTDFFAQDWLYAALKWINLEDFLGDPLGYYQKYIKFLEELDRAAMLERLQKSSDLKNLFYTFTKDSFIDTTLIKNLDDVLHKGTSTQHYWFYKLDYLLWKQFDWKQSFKNPFTKLNYSDINKEYRLTRLNSIEHIHPQSKKNEWNLNEECHVDDFGNLALISNHMNSALNAQQDIDKRLDIQKQVQKKTLESLKMILIYSKYEQWNQKNCEEHQNEMITLLKNDIGYTFDN